MNTTAIYTDSSSLMSLRAQAGTDPSAALEKTAEQFESMFIHMMLKSMRSTTSGEGLFESEHSRVYQEMFDQQISVEMAQKRQVGIADMLVRQLGDQVSSGEETERADGFDLSRLHRPLSSVAVEAFAPLQDISNETIDGFDSPEDFVKKLWPMAEKYASELGVDPRVLLAQSALETGWGQHVIQHSNGVPSHNLFNIKADSRWDGPKAVVPTLEYESGKAVSQYAAFRSYPGYEDSFSDYVDFVQSGQRYQGALENASDSQAYIKALDDAGYATDPRYHDKIMKIMTGDVMKQAATEFSRAANESII